MELSEKLETLNLQRRKECTEAHLLAEELAGTTTDPLIMVGSNQIHAGIIGIVAARLAESRKRPAIVYERQQDESRASARSIPQFDIVNEIFMSFQVFNHQANSRWYFSTSFCPCHP